MKLVKSKWETALLVCRRCTKRQKGGFGRKGRTPLAKALKRAVKGRRPKVGVVETKCLGVCPRHAVTVLDARNPREWLLVKPGSGADEIIAALGLGETAGSGSAPLASGVKLVPTA